MVQVLDELRGCTKSEYKTSNDCFFTVNLVKLCYDIAHSKEWSYVNDSIAATEASGCFLENS